MTTLVYRYGLTAPYECADLVYVQFRLAHEYRWALVRIERTRRAEERVVRSAASAELRDAEEAVRAADAECERLASVIRAVRKNERKRSETALQREALADARAKMRAARDVLFAIREAQRSQCRECRAKETEENPCPHATHEAAALRHALDEVDERASTAIRAAREASGLYWGTYLLVEKAMQASRSMPLYGKDGVTPNDPDGPHNRDVSTIAVQLQGGLSVAEALGCKDTRLHVREPAWPEEWLAAHPSSVTEDADKLRGREPAGYRPAPKGTPLEVAPAMRADGTPARWLQRRSAREGELRMRVGSNEKGGPIWAAWRLDYHRPLPKGAKITWASVYRRMRGPHAEWSLCVTVDMPTSSTAPASGQRALDVVAIDVGWRVIGDELRVAAWHDSTGKSGELRLSVADLRALHQPEEIRSQRDVAFDACKMTLGRWIASSPDAPDWMREEAKHMPQWRRTGRMVVLLRRWTEERPDRKPDEDLVFQTVESWANQDRRRWAEESSRRTWSLRRRREVYRVFAAKMASVYGTIVLERFDLRRVTVRTPTGDDVAENETAHSNRQLAAVSELRETLLNGSRNRGTLVVGVDARNSTRICPSCGLVEDRDAAATIVLTCECGHVWDQDVEGAAPVLLARYREKPSDAEILGGARADGSPAKVHKKNNGKWAKAKKLGKAKAARLDAARKVVSDGAE